MTIESKFNIGDKVWFPANHKYYVGEVTNIKYWEHDRGFLVEVSYAVGELATKELLYDTELYALEDKELIINKLFIYPDE